jgi:DNA-binding NtrC family response regulator
VKTSLPLVCLVIDDDPDDIEFFKIAVSKLSLPIEVIAFTDCNLATEKLLNSEIDPHFIMLDSRFNATNGHECLEKIKTKLNIKEIPVIIITGGISAMEETQYADAGVYKSLTKPNTIPELQTLLKTEFSLLFPSFKD